MVSDWAGARAYPPLVPVAGAEADDGGGERFVATNTEPWLDVEYPGLGRFAGSLVTISYRSSRWDIPARPLLRFLSADDILGETIAPAPVDAAACWTGRIPAGTTRLHVSPTNRRGPFAFRIESIRRRSWTALLAEGFERAPGPTRSTVLTRLIGWRPEADNNLAWAIGAHPLQTYSTWLEQRARPFEPDGIDRPRSNWSEALPIVVTVAVESGDADELERTLDGLRRQSFPRWEALVCGPTRLPTAADQRVRYASSIADAAAVLAGEGTWFCAIPAGAVLPPQALAMVCEARACHPEAPMVYGDEVVGGRPAFKPGWDPRLASARPYLGRSVFANSSLFTAAQLADILRDGRWFAPAGTVPLPLRRILVERPAEPVAAEEASAPAAANSGGARAALVILTRDQPMLLTRLIRSIRARSAPGSFSLVVVDNGEPGGPAAAALADLAAATDTTILARRGPFNFSALCNEAVAACEEPVIVFLNDDMEILSDGWLDRLTTHALAPSVGAVGARLTYPDGRLQHVGVLAGMGGSAGHFGAPAPPGDRGWIGRNEVTHDVTAVTGACLAVAREKFVAIGGFDAEHLPVELSDIDLCFKLNARGWQTIIDPAVHLLHEESFSRGGATFRRLSKYGDQRDTFCKRWRHVLRDDPLFHPALSLYSTRVALG